MYLLVGLRNPEPEFDGTRHNVGAEPIQTLAGRHGLRFRRARRGTRALVARFGTGAEGAVLALPTTGMNISGQAVSPLLRYFGVKLSELLILHDDIDLPFGKLRVQFGRGSGGHNGVDSVIGSLGSSGFWRLKLGVGRPPGSQDPADYVLRRFTVRERPLVDVMVSEAADALEIFVEKGPEEARQQAGEMGRS